MMTLRLITVLPTDLRDMLYNHNWPGNVRELKNTIQRYLATDSVAQPGQPYGKSDEGLSSDPHLQDAVDSLEKRMIIQALEQTKWRRGQTAELLNIPRRSLQRKMHKFGLHSNMK